jgi:hypothetical protein
MMLDLMTELVILKLTLVLLLQFLLVLLSSYDRLMLLLSTNQ